MAIALNRGSILIPLPLNPKEEKLLLDIIKKYLDLIRKKKLEKARNFILKHTKELHKIFMKLSVVDPTFSAAQKIIFELEKSYFGKHGHANEFRILRCLRDLAEEFEIIEEKLYSIKKIGYH